MAPNKEVKKHIVLGKNGKPEKYTYPGTVVTTSNIPSQDRAIHGANLKSQIDAVKAIEHDLTARTDDYELETVIGIQICFESFPGVELAFESLADAKQGIELLNVQIVNNKYVATVLVPAGKICVLEKKIEAYMAYKKDCNGKPLDNRTLIDAIASIRRAVLVNLWADDPELYPTDSEEEVWLEVWLPVLGDRQAVINDFKKIAKIAGIRVANNVLEFPERSVFLAKGSINAFGSSSLLISKISELRKAKFTADFFDHLEINEQRDFSSSLLERATFASDNPPYICILDTGVNSGHPLLSPICSENDLFVVNPDWDAADSNGHGTAMAGLAIWGDLSNILAESTPLQIGHRIESAKLLRFSGDNEDKHLGIITSDGISEAEIANFERTRVFALALSALKSRDRGKPSAWSATIDGLTSDYLGENLKRRLMIVCGGNTGDDLTGLKEYPQYNELQDIHDPGQAWNALTVGAYTKKIDIRDDGADSYKPLAPEGGLSPYSTTSVTWSSSMPLKPDVVFEGGNMGIDTYSAASMSSLQLLTTHHNITNRLFSTFNATSAATALAAKFAAEIYVHYPTLWPETVRALMVHSASWTEAMMSQFNYRKRTEKQKAQHLVRVVGYGVPDINKALWSLGNSLVMIVEDELQPFEKQKGKSPSTKDMHLHDLPWPKEQLMSLGETQVRMTVTLSYFIEPNPSSRNVSSKYRYPSHQLRFEVKRPTESTKQFMQRITRDARDEEEGTIKPPIDPDWLLGNFRNKGSIHKDIWRGTGAELAARGLLAIYPAMGWWRTRTKLERFNKAARYSLIISIEAPEVDVDLYTPIQTEIENRNKVSVEITA